VGRQLHCVPGLWRNRYLPVSDEVSLRAPAQRRRGGARRGGREDAAGAFSWPATSASVGFSYTLSPRGGSTSPRSSTVTLPRV